LVAEFIKKQVSDCEYRESYVINELFVSASIMCQVNMYLRSLIFLVKLIRKVYVSNLNC